jgi:hypothetical protein
MLSSVMEATIDISPRGTARLAAGVLAAALMLAGATSADAARKIASAKLMCDKRVGTAKAKCVKRPAKALKRSVVRKEFPQFGAQVRSDPRVVVSGGRALTARRSPVSVSGATARTHTSDSSSPSKRDPVSPVLECVSRDGAKYVAHFGYSNKNASRVEIAVGSSNRFTPGENLGQPTLFQSGRLVDVFQVTFAGGNLVWTLDGRTATASPNSKACATPPVPAFFPDQVAVVPLDAAAGGAEYQGLRAVGVPAVIAPTIAEAVKYRIVILAGAPAAGTIAPDDISRLGAYAASGAVLVGEALTDPKLLDIFGISATSERTDRSTIDWITKDDETVAELDRASERHVDIDDRFGSAFRTVGYAEQKSVDVLARFDDGTAVGHPQVRQGRRLRVRHRRAPHRPRHPPPRGCPLVRQGPVPERLRHQRRRVAPVAARHLPRPRRRRRDHVDRPGRQALRGTPHPVAQLLGRCGPDDRLRP